MFSPSVDNLVAQLTRLPSVGQRTAQRLAFHILRVPKDEALALAAAIAEVKERVRFCRECGNLTEEETCDICRDERRDHTIVCVVEQPADLISVERTHEYRGLYHVLGGALSPLDGVEPEHLRIDELLGRVERNGVQEVVLATNPNMTGEATAASCRPPARPGARDPARERPSRRRRPRVRGRGHARQGALGPPRNVEPQALFPTLPAVTTTEFEALPASRARSPRLGTLVMIRRHLGRRPRQDQGRRTPSRGRAGRGQPRRGRALGNGRLHRRPRPAGRDVSASRSRASSNSLISVGERISCALAAMAIHDLGAEAISLDRLAGRDRHRHRARPREDHDIRARRIHEALDQDRIVLVAGFQGVSTDLTSPPSAAAAPTRPRSARGAAVGVEVCEIYTDVDGVFTADPRLVSKARKLHAVSYEECSSWPRRARQRCCRYAGRDRAQPFRQAARPPLRTRRETTNWIREEDERMLEKALISGVTHTREETLYRVERRPAALFGALAEASVNVDTIAQHRAGDPLSRRRRTTATPPPRSSTAEPAAVERAGRPRPRSA